MSAIRRITTVLFCLVSLAACQEDGASTTDSESAFPDLLRLQREACEKDRGNWGLAANKTTYVCYRSLPDANKTCSVESDCEGLCLARSRTCSPVTPFYGCHQVLSNSGVPQTLCVE